MDDRDKELFFPYYVNQSRLLDIYAILNSGYSDYEEVTVSEGEEKTNSAKGKASGSAGFKIFKISADAEGNFEKAQTSQSETAIKKVQTITSILSIVIEELKNRKYLKDITSSKVGSFIRVPVILKINSVVGAFNEISEVMNLIKDIEKLGTTSSIKSSDIQQIDKISKALKPILASEEIVFDSPQFALIGNISDKHLYQASQNDIIGTELICLAQVKKIYPHGTELLKNSTFGKFKDKALKESLIQTLNNILNNDSYDFSSTVIASIEEKPVYDVEIIALYQTEK